MKKCSVPGCKNKYRAKGLCGTHWSQMKRRGKILKVSRLSPNTVETKTNYAEVILRNTYADEVGRTFVDLEDIELIKNYKWYLTGSGYAMTRMSKNKQLFLHRLIMNPKKDKVIDHINGDPLDNRKENLRICTQSENLLNRKLSKNNTTGVAGVKYDKHRKSYVARITVEGKEIYLGQYSTLQEAKKIRFEAEKKYFGEYRRMEVE